MKTTRHLIPVIAALCFTAATTRVQAQGDLPPNDHCEDITPLALAVDDTLVFTGTNEGATFDGDNAPGSGLSNFGVPVVWVAFTTSECADVAISFCGSTAPFLTEYFWDVVTPQCPADELTIATGYNNTACADGQPVVLFDALAAGTYYYPVWAQPGTAIGEYVISISATACAPAGPANDLCSGAQPHNLDIGGSVTINGDNTGATDTEGYGMPVVWESFTLAQCANVTLDHCGTDPAFTTYAFGIYGDCPATLFVDTTSAGSCPDGNMSVTYAGLAPGTYWIPVVMEAGVAEGAYTINVAATPCAGPANNYCNGAELHDLAVGDTLTLTGDNNGAEDNEGLGYANVWESFTLAECANVSVGYCGTDSAFSVFATGIYADCPATQLIQQSSTDTCASGNPVQTFTELAAGTYWIPVLMTPDSAEGVYTINVTAVACEAAAPANDLCADAASITVVAPDSCATGVVVGTNINATGSGDMPTCADPAQNWQDVWYTFNTGGADEAMISLVPGTIAGAGMELFAACGDSSLACSIDGSPIELTQLTDTIYHVRIFTQDDGTPGTFALCVTSDNTTGISSMDRGTVHLYPNPGTGDFTFVPSVSWTNARITVLDMTGRTVHVAQADLKAGEAYPLSLAGTLKAGSYLFHVTSTQGSSMVKLMVK